MYASMKRLIVILCVLFFETALTVQVTKAEESLVNVQKSENALSIYAKSLGIGETLEEAKLDAYNKILPLLINKTQGAIPAMHESYRVNKVESAQGIENLMVDKMLLQGYWELKDGKYIYKSELLIDNTKQE